MADIKSFVPDRNKVKKWIKTCYGPGTEFPSTRALSDSAGRSLNTVSIMGTTGKVTAETIVDICYATKKNVLKTFVELGMIKQSDLDELQVWKDSTPEETEILELFQSLDDNVKIVALKLMRELPRLQPDLEKKPPRPRSKSQASK
tara:strand:- start:2854 stop:3291 length:438 start_codon:yes stop_codon:yes gene_type:complete